MGTFLKIIELRSAELTFEPETANAMWNYAIYLLANSQYRR